MKQLTSKLWAKITALILITVFAIAFAACLLGTAYMADSGGYTLSADTVINNALRSDAFWTQMNTAESYYTCLLREEKENNEYDTTYYENHFIPENSNFFFTVTDTKGKTLFKSPGWTDDYRFRESSEYSITYNWREVTETRTFDSEDAQQQYIEGLIDKNFQLNDYSTESLPDGRVRSEINYTCFDFDTVIITGYVRQELTANDTFYAVQFWLLKLIQLRYWLIVFAAVSLLLVLALFVYLLCAAGHKEGVGGIHLNWVDRIPLDLYLTAMGFVIVFVCALWVEAIDNSAWYLGALASLIALAVLMPLVMSILMTIATRFKAGDWWRNTVIYHICRLFGRFFRWLCHGVRAVMRAIPLVWQAIVIWGGISLLELIVFAASANQPDALFAWWLLGKCILTPIIILTAIAMRRLQAGGKALADGDLNYSIDTRHLHLALRQHAENLNSIADGMQKAVNEQMRSERFRTELITNVSHDIKTPLTSIVNYVDLLKKEDVQPEKAREYIAVLDRQSARLKKLTEDLVEASKASTGALPVNLEPTEVNVLLGQVAGEYLDRLEAAGLEPVFKPDPSAPKIMADGKLLWRVFDNLLSNICKYALPGTRMYFSSEVCGETVVITFRNISRYALDISADELMERFVRGDASRSTEGSGLGLSIAQSLTQLQKGTFRLAVDGDLFKAIVTFDLLT